MDQLRSPSRYHRDMTPIIHNITCVLSIEVMIRKSQPCKRPVEELGQFVQLGHEGALSVDFRDSSMYLSTVSFVSKYL